MVASVRGGRQRVVRCFLGGVLTAVVVLASAVGRGNAQVRKPRQQRAHRETNASRQARIQRTIDATYAHRWEVFGGGGYLRWRSGEGTKKNNEVNWEAQTSYYLNPKLAIIGDAQGSFGSAHAIPFDGFPQASRPQINEYFFTGGASYRFYAKEKLALSAQATGGIADGVFSKGAKGLTGPEVGLWPDGYKPAFKLSVSADYNIDPTLALRFAPTYVGSTFGGDLQNSLGFNAGIVYRFGRQK